MNKAATEYKIEEHWDPSGHITADCDPAEEFERWHSFAQKHPQDFPPDTFTIADFEKYIEGLKP